MSNVYNLFTKQAVHLAVDLPEATPLWSFDRIKESLRARYSDKMPAFVEKAWLKPQTEPYRFGCAHNVQWREFKTVNWNKPHPFPMPMDPETDCIGRKVDKGGTDPCAWIDMKYQVTLNHVRSRRGKALTIHTRSDLIAHDDYVEALDKDHHTIYIYGLQAVESVVRQLEPGAPSNKRRGIAFDKLRGLGFNVKWIWQFKSVASKAVKS